MAWDKTAAKKRRNDLTDNESEVWVDIANESLGSCKEAGNKTNAKCKQLALRDADAAINKTRLNKQESKLMKSVIDIVRMTEANNLRILEADEDKRRLLIQVIKPGRSLNDTIYPESTMQEVVNLLSDHKSMSQKQFVDHQNPEDSNVRSVNDWASTVREVFIPGDNPSKGVQAWVQFLPIQSPNGWIFEAAVQQPDQVRFSIDCYAMVEQVDDGGDGKPGIMIHHVTAMRSVDIVVWDSAGGEVITEGITDVTEMDNVVAEANRVLKLAPDCELASILEDFSGTRVMQPFTNEHACRLKNPKNYTRFTRTKRTSEGGKEYSVITGWKKSGSKEVSEEQAFRYAKGSWTEAAAKKHCKKHKGTFEAAKKASVDPTGQAATREADDEKKKVVPFKTKIENEEVRMKIYRLSWQLQDYIRENLFNEDEPVKKRLEASKDAVDTVFQEVEKLKKKLNDEELEEEHRKAEAYGNPVKVAQIIIEEGLADKPVTADIEEQVSSAQDNVISNLQDRGLNGD